MGARTRDFGLASALLFAGLALGRAGESSAGFEVATKAEPTTWTVLYHGRKVMVYSFAPQKFKPYVQELCTLRGENILRDAPHDHRHHHALMYGIKVNGINFWEEVPGCGVEKAVENPKPVVGVADPQGRSLPQVQIRQKLHWLAPEDAFLPDNVSPALLVEHRTLTLTLDPSNEEVALEWRSQFEVGNMTNTVVLSGANYHGLGMRFLEELDAAAVHSLAGVRPDLANARQDVSTAPWACVAFDIPGHPATIGVAGHPSNARGDAVFFSMLSPFAYLSATQRLDQEPLVYHAGEKFQLSYLVLLYPESKPTDDLRHHVEAWRKLKL